MLLVLRLVTAAAYVAMLRRRGVRVIVPLDRTLLRDLAAYVPVTGTIPVVNAVYARADMFMLSSLASWHEVGLYSAALRLVDLARSISPAYARALYPVLARLRAPDAHARFTAAARQALRHVLVLSLPVALALFGLAEPLIRLLYGGELLAAAGVLRVLCWAVVPLALAVTLAQVLFSANRQDVDLQVNVVGTLVSVAGCALLIPRFGALGAAIAVVLATTVYAGLEYLGTRARVAAPAVAGDLARLLGATAAAALCMALAGDAHPVAATALGLAVYAAGLLATGAVTRDELQRWVRALRLRGVVGRRAVLEERR
jgi:O-antigen/teichoic acid export membrane protein